jgi:hypothetical protein
MQVQFEFAGLNGLSHRFSNEEKFGGKDGVRDFCKRRILSLCIPEQCSLGIIMRFNRIQGQKCFENFVTKTVGIRQEI